MLTLTQPIRELYELFQNLPEEKFEISTVAALDPDCGAVCCVSGHAATLPSMKAKGFSLEAMNGVTHRLFIKKNGELVTYDSEEMSDAMGIDQETWWQLTNPATNLWDRIAPAGRVYPRHVCEALVDLFPELGQ